jgi:epoxyqueuosine reductase
LKELKQMSDITLTAVNANLQEFQIEVTADVAGIVSIENTSQKRIVEDALRLLPGTNSVVVLATEIFPEILDQTRPERITGHVSMNDLYAVHLDYINGRLTNAAYDIAHACRSNGMKALPLSATACPTDARFMEAVFSYKHAAQAAGLGYIGRNSLLLTHDFGPRVRLSCCLTEAKFKPLEKKAATNKCTDCSICIKGCPSGALQIADEREAYSINKFACSAFRSAAGGCSECMRLCPAAR